MEAFVVPDEAAVVEEVQDKCSSKVMLFNRKSYAGDEMLMVVPPRLDAISLPCIPDIVGEEEALVDDEEEYCATKEVQKMVASLNVARVSSQDVVEDCWDQKGGAYTGEVGIEMLVDLNVPWREAGTTVNVVVAHTTQLQKRFLI